MKTLKKIWQFLGSMPFMGILAVILACAMAVATIIENRNGTLAARAMIYQAWWFNLAVFLVFINIIANMIRWKLYNLKRLPIFIFHIAFMVIIAGAALTRFTSSEGIMHIREGETVSTYLSSDTYFFVSAENRWGKTEKYQKVLLSPATPKQVNLSFNLGEDHIRIRSIGYATGASMDMGGNMSGEGPMPDIIQLKITINNGSEKVMIKGKTANLILDNSFELSGIKFKAGFGSRPMTLPFSLTLNDFQLEKYPGSLSPSSFASVVVLNDPADNSHRPFRIFMNNILKHKGYRFYQSSYDTDEQGTILSVNHDAWGTGITYMGYFLMFAGIVLSFFAPGSRFKKLLKESRKPVAVAGLALTLLLLPACSVSAQHPAPPDIKEAKAFGRMCVQGNEGRVKPVSTLSSEMMRKLFGKNKLYGMVPEQFWLSLMIEPQQWSDARIFTVKDKEIARLFHISGGKGAYHDFFKDGDYLMGDLVKEAIQKRPDQRNGVDKSIIKLDEQLNVFYLGMTGQLLRLFPDGGHPKAAWVAPGTVLTGIGTSDSTLIAHAFSDYLKAIGNRDLTTAQQIRSRITHYQMAYGSSMIPSERRITREIFYNRALIFERLVIVYAMIGLLFLVVQLLALFKPMRWHQVTARIFGVLLVLAWILHSVGLGLRWYISGHAPMSNGYESMLFVAWGTLLAGFLMARRSMLPMALTSVLAALSLLVAHLSWMSPEITPLVPVLKSPWLTIHVAVVMTSYSFLGLGALIGLVVLVLFLCKTRNNQVSLNEHIRQLTRINQMVLIAGLYLITIGCFLGAIWANQSWGRYWGWDPKETWCLITILIYSFVVHMHHIKDFNNDFAFNLGSLLAFGSVLMTYFGVNYFLGGMHAYAGGAAPSIPIAVYVFLILLIGLIYAAWFNEMRFQPKDTR